jgi:hypothetical protein
MFVSQATPMNDQNGNTAGASDISKFPIAERLQSTVASGAEVDSGAGTNEQWRSNRINNNMTTPDGVGLDHTRHHRAVTEETAS